MKINSPLLYYRLFVLLPLSLSLINLSTAWANCEAGGYSIHTIAEYRSSNRLGTFYYFYKQKGKNHINVFNTVVGDSQGVSPPNFRQDDIRVYLGKTHCTLNKSITAKIETTHVKDVYDAMRRETKIFFDGCESFFSRLSNNGYIVINDTSNKIYLPQALDINTDLKPTKSEISEITKDIKDRIKQKKLVQGRISNKNVKKITVTKTTVGNVNPPFRMGVGILLLNNPFEVYPDMEGYRYYGEEYMDFKDKLFEFPVLYFTSSENKFSYIGDGESCGHVPMFYRNIQKVNSEMQAKDDKYKPKRKGYSQFKNIEDYPLGDKMFNLGPTDRFTITGAFDLTGDGYPNIIRVNERFVYSILEDEKIIVINYGMGG